VLWNGGRRWGQMDRVTGCMRVGGVDMVVRLFDFRVVSGRPTLRIRPARGLLRCASIRGLPGLGSILFYRWWRCPGWGLMDWSGLGQVGELSAVLLGCWLGGVRSFAGGWSGGWSVALVRLVSVGGACLTFAQAKRMFFGRLAGVSIRVRLVSLGAGGLGRWAELHGGGPLPSARRLVTGAKVILAWGVEAVG